MSKILNKYNELKSINSDKLYLFESGIFYIFINEDAKMINEKLDLKIVQQKDYYKCGFPINSKDKYFKILEEKDINYEIIVFEKSKSILTNSVKSSSIEQEIIRKLKSINVEYYTPIEALNFLKELKEIIK